MSQHALITITSDNQINATSKKKKKKKGLSAKLKMISNCNVKLKRFKIIGTKIQVTSICAGIICITKCFFFNFVNFKDYLFKRHLMQYYFQGSKCVNMCNLLATHQNQLET